MTDNRPRQRDRAAFAKTTPRNGVAPGDVYNMGHHRTEAAIRAFALSLLLLFLAGCATQAERAAQVQREVEQMIQLYGPGCERLGYKADTDPWRECVLKLAHREDQYNRYPISTNCFRHRGFMQCTTF